MDACTHALVVPRRNVVRQTRGACVARDSGHRDSDHGPEEVGEVLAGAVRVRLGSSVPRGPVQIVKISLLSSNKERAPGGRKQGGRYIMHEVEACHRVRPASRRVLGS